MTIPALAVMGSVALTLQQLADFGVGIYVRDLTPAQIVAIYKTPAGAIYAFLLAAFAVMPLIVNIDWRKRDD